MYLKMEQAQIDELNRMLKVNDDAHKMGVLDHQKAYVGLVNLLNRSFSVVEEEPVKAEKVAEMNPVADNPKLKKPNLEKTSKA